MLYSLERHKHGIHHESDTLIDASIEKKIVATTT